MHNNRKDQIELFILYFCIIALIILGVALFGCAIWILVGMIQNKVVKDFGNIIYTCMIFALSIGWICFSIYILKYTIKEDSDSRQRKHIYKILKLNKKITRQQKN